MMSQRRALCSIHRVNGVIAGLGRHGQWLQVGGDTIIGIHFIVTTLNQTASTPQCDAESAERERTTKSSDANRAERATFHAAPSTMVINDGDRGCSDKSRQTGPQNGEQKSRVRRRKSAQDGKGLRSERTTGRRVVAHARSNVLPWAAAARRAVRWDEHQGRATRRRIDAGGKKRASSGVSRIATMSKGLRQCRGMPR